MDSSNWATQQLAAFLTVLTGAADEREAVVHALERLAESSEADAGAFVTGGHVTSSLGWALGSAPEPEIVAVAKSERATIDLAGVGWCETVAIPVDRDSGTTIVLVRSVDAFTTDEVGLLRSMARVLALALRLLGTVASERRQAALNHELVLSLRERQALLERLSQIQHQITSRSSLQAVLDAVTAGAAELLGEGIVMLQLVDDCDPDTMTTVSSVGISPDHPDLSRVPTGTGIGGRAVIENRPCVDERIQGFGAAIGPQGQAVSQSAVAAPVHREGQPVGCLIVASRRPGVEHLQRAQEVAIAFAEHASLALNDARTVEAMKRALDDATHQAMHDELTGLPNRACFFDRTDQALRQAARDGSCTAVLLFDLNRFKEINDTLGHKYGDRVLREVGPRINQGLRDGDTLARLGGDEFCVLLPRIEGHGAALQVAERIISLLEEPFDIEGMTMDVAASCGIAIAPKDGDSADMLLQRSDVAMYVAKDTHEDIVIYDDELNINTRERLALLGELRTAIAKEQFVLHYQPKVTLDSGQVEGVEALIRWQHPTMGLVPPIEFISLAEHTGLIKPLTSWVLDAALRQLRCWRDEGGHAALRDLSMAVNLSARSLLDDNFPSEVVAALDRWHVPAGLLELEITETTIMADPSRAHRILAELAAVGVKLTIDDFGTGYSSLAYLKNLPVNQLKIDRSFVMHMHQDLNDAVIVRSVIDLGHNLGLRTVAEGIEDARTRDELTSLGCDSGQGYLLARPMPSQEIGEWIREQGEAHLAGPLTWQR
ncbi:MAG: EAL domain-containing protein [Acidimicrobiales bacterium]